jgi:hypothetical protein
MIAPLAVDLRALRVLVGPDIKIVPGRAVMARVVQAQQPGGRGSLSIAGYLLDAELPSSVHTGDDLRLVVKDVSAERVLLTISDAREESPAPQAQQTEQSQQAQPLHTPLPDPSLVAQPPVPLPGGGSVQVTEREAGGAARRSAERQDVLLRYNAPALGAVDLRFQMDAGARPGRRRVPAPVAGRVAARAGRVGDRGPAPRATGSLCLTSHRLAGAPPPCTTNPVTSHPR